MHLSAEVAAPDLRYPIGPFQPPSQITKEAIGEWTRTIERLPEALAHAVADLADEQLDMPYRPNGWTVRQLVHHVADSHMNSYVRYRLALTEENPLIRGYDEKGWAELPDAKAAPVGPSLAILTGLHQRWVALLRQLNESQWARTFQHPERGRLRLDATTALYAWHGEHHTAHIRSLRERENW